METPPDSLFERLSTYTPSEFENWIGIDSVEWEEHDVIVRVTVHELGKNADKWSIRCRDVRESRIESEAAISNIGLTTRHPLLIPHKAMIADLFFNGLPPDVDRVIGQLFDVHNELLGSWYNFLRFFNLGRSNSLRDLMLGGFGVLAKGPQILLERYEQVISSNSVMTSLLPSHAATW